MTVFQCAFKATGNTAEVTIQRDNATLPSGATDIGNIIHDADPDNLSGDQDIHDNHVLYQHVQELCYKHGWLDMQNVKIVLAATSISIDQGATGAVTAAAGASHTLQLTATVGPTDAVDKSVTWSTSDATKATVSSTGLVTGVAAGSATITAKPSVDAGVSDTIAITVS
ncbi:putative structural Ig-like protein [Rhizobium phage RHph_Y2_6]|uniref:Structural Ig-like protein n=2 Tax=Acanvirus TaxID=3044653 RepID=A0AAE8B499_9CAUD|nr:putative structural Ig-like protein [Rhizobium phage RHph_Y2_6]YP_010658350.1 putative structural Ig-like protein [Rhizobium phage RHEph16]QIG68781.1 putative structural Ig-like protein [Rhizobium phage RHph_Y2_6]QXV74349.1 putative structural Ig-like protein [Rhizobium phage RHEph16]